jgi:type IV secretory pathway VirB2 component (pilin)
MKIHILREKIKSVSKKVVTSVTLFALTAPMAFAGGLQVIQTDANTVQTVLKDLAPVGVGIGILAVGYQMLFADRKHPALFRVAVAAFLIGGSAQLATWLLGSGGAF